MNRPRRMFVKDLNDISKPDRGLLLDRVKKLDDLIDIEENLHTCGLLRNQNSILLVF